MAERHKIDKGKRSFLRNAGITASYLLLNTTALSACNNSDIVSQGNLPSDSESFTQEGEDVAVYKGVLRELEGLEYIFDSRLRTYIETIKGFGTKLPTLTETATHLESLTSDPNPTWFSDRIDPDGFPLAVVRAPEGRLRDINVYNTPKTGKKFYLLGDDGILEMLPAVEGIRPGVIIYEPDSNSQSSLDTTSLRLAARINNIQSIFAGVQDMGHFVDNMGFELLDENGRRLEGVSRAHALTTVFMELSTNEDSAYSLVARGASMLLQGKYASEIGDEIDISKLNDEGRLFTRLYQEDREVRRSADELDEWWRKNQYPDKRGLYLWIALEAHHVEDSLRKGYQALNPDQQAGYDIKIRDDYKFMIAAVIPPQYEL